jgi:riboflavin kinase / FMN adenylyltransferase
LQILTSLSEIPKGIGPSAITIGKFDCIHLGHQALFAEVVDAAANQNLTPTVVTFDRHPDHLLRPERAKLPILGPGQKADLIAGFGVSTMLQLEFNQELADLTPEQFVKQILVDGLKAKLVLVGEGFRFGNQGSGNFGHSRLWVTNTVSKLLSSSECMSMGKLFQRPWSVSYLTWETSS